MATRDRERRLRAYAEQRRAGSIYEAGIYEDASRYAIARSLAHAQRNMETLRLYAKSIVRLLEACDAEVDELRQLAEIAFEEQPCSGHKSMDLDFVRADIDRLVGEAQAQLSVVNNALVSSANSAS